MIRYINMRKFLATLLSAGMFFMNMPVSVLASEISGFNQTSGTFNIEAAKVSGNTGFRHYEKFDLSKGDIANLIYKENYSKFVNLVDNKININGIVNTMKDNNFYNGHAIFVSPEGIVVGASGVLNVGSLTLLAPSVNSYNAFKTLYDDKQLEHIKFDLTNENYKSLIRNSSGEIVINGRIFARETVDVYGRQINVQRAENSTDDPAIFAGWKDENTSITTQDKAQEVFNSLVSNNMTNAFNFNLEDGKISLVTNKANEEIITVEKSVEENAGNNNDSDKKTYKVTETYNVDSLLKTTVKEDPDKDDDADDKKVTTNSIDKTYEKSSLSSKNSSIKIKNAKIASNEVKIEANASSEKVVTENTIKTYGKAAKDAEDADKAADKDKADKDKDKKDDTTGYKIPKIFRGAAPETTATVKIEDSQISGEKINIRANASAKTETYIQLLDPVWEKWLALLGVDILLRILSDEEIPPEVPFVSVESVKNYFSDKAYDGFDGSKASATVEIQKSDIFGKKSVDISSKANSTTKITTGKLDSHPLFFYGLGSSANAATSILGSVIKTQTEGDKRTVNITASSNIDNKTDYDSSNFLAISDKPQDNNNNQNNNNNNQQQSTVSAYNLTLLNNSIFSKANVKISDSGDKKSNIETKDFNGRAVAFNQSDITVKNVSNVGEDSSKSALALAMVINHTDTEANVIVEKGSAVKTANDTNILVQNINSISNTVKTEVKAENQTYDIKTKDVTTYDPTYTIKAYDWLNSKFLGKLTDKLGNVIDKASLELAGSAIWNDEHNDSSAVVNASTIDAKNLDVSSNMVDFTLNNSEAEPNANNKINSGMAIIVNDQNNTNNAKIVNGSKITAADGFNISATTQLPMNPTTLKFGQKTGSAELFIGGSFDNDGSVSNWDKDFIYTKFEDILDFSDIDWDSLDGWLKLKDVDYSNAIEIIKALKSPRELIGGNELSLDGMFNNLVKAEGSKAEDSNISFGLAGSVLVNNLVNDTYSYVEDSEVNVTNGNVVVNAANSVINYNGAGKVDFLIEEINSAIEKIRKKENRTHDEELAISKVGMGGSVIVSSNTNNAASYIKNSKVKANGGDIKVNSVTEEGYINLAVIGSKASTLVVDGAVNVQRIDGKTKAYIENSQEIKADNVEVNAGKGYIWAKKSGDDAPIELDDGKLSVRDSATDLTDTVMNISLIGVNANQEGTGASVGAAVNVTSITKEIDGYVKNSTIDVTQDLSVTASTISRKIDILAAGAFAGGVSTDKSKQQSANDGDNSGDDKPQKMANAGNWMDELDKADDDATDVMNLDNLFNQNDANAQGKAELDQNKQNKNKGLKANRSNNNLTGGNNTADTTTARSNLSIALAGAVDVTNDFVKTTARIENSAINAGKDVNVKAENNTLAVQINGGLGMADTVSAGAGVNIYNNKSETISLVDNSTINFKSPTAHKLNVTSDANIDLIDVTAGIGVSKGSKGSVKASVGGSFGMNKLKNKVSAKLNKVTTSKDEGAADTDVKVKATDDSYIFNATGAASFGKNANTNLGAGIAATVNYSQKEIIAEVVNSTLKDVKDLTVNADLKQDYTTIAASAALSFGATSSYTFDGAVTTELNKNTVSANVKNSVISASSDVGVIAKADIDTQSLAAPIAISSANQGVYAGIGAVINVNGSSVTAQTDGVTAEKSKTFDIRATEDENLKFLTANLGLQATWAGIGANGIIDVFKSDVVAQAVNGSVLNSDGDVNIQSLYDNTLQGITAHLNTASKAAIGANIILNSYGNAVISLLDNNSKILKAGKLMLNAQGKEYLNLIPAGVALSSTAAVAASVNANIINGTAQALLKGNVDESSSVSVNALDETTIFSRGGIGAFASTAGIGGIVNIDKIAKNVTASVSDGAKVTSSGTVDVLAKSINSFGGTKNAQDQYDREDVTTDDYKNNMLNKNSKGEYVGLKYNSSFDKWNMFYNVGGAGTATLAGTVIIKTIENEVNTRVTGAEIKASNLNVLADDYSIKNIIAGQASGSGVASLGAQVLITNDRSTTNALISGGSNLDITNTINLNALNRKDNHQIIVAANGAGVFAGGVNVAKNVISDTATAKIDNVNGEIKSAALNINANEDMNASHIMVTGAGAGAVAISVAPIINSYLGTTEAAIVNSNIKNAAIDIDAENNIDSFDVSAGVSGAGTGFAGSGVAIKNNYTTNTKAYINNSVIDTHNAISVDANSVINSENWIGALAGVGMGVGAVVDIILNNVLSQTEAGIKNSAIENAGVITINANKGKQDNIKNIAISLGAAGSGADALVNVIQNIYSDNVSAYSDNNAVTNAVSLSVLADSDRTLNNKSVGITISGLGVSLYANAIVNQIDSSANAYVNAQEKNMQIANALNVSAANDTDVSNTIGQGALSGTAAIGANIILYTANNIAKAEVLSGSGKINAGSSSVSSEIINGLENLNVGVSLGFASIAGDVALIKLGKRTDNYAISENKSQIDKAVNYTKDIYDNITANDEAAISGKYTPTSSAGDIETGSIARVNGNLAATADIAVSATSRLKGKGSNEKLDLTNVSVGAGLLAAGVGIKDVQLANNTLAEVSGGKIESSNGNVSVLADNKSNVGIKNVEVNVSGLAVSGGSAIYNNSSETTAQIKDALIAAKNVNVNSKSTSKSDISNTAVVVSIVNGVGVSIAENKDNNKSVAKVTGNTNIDSDGDLNISSNVTTDLVSTNHTVEVSGASLVNYMTNEVTAHTISKAIIENVNGTINAGNISLTTDYDIMRTKIGSNIVSVNILSAADIGKAGAFMKSEFVSGIDSDDNYDLTINNSGTTTITTARDNGTGGIVSEAGADFVKAALASFYAGSKALAENKVSATSVLKAKEHNAHDLTINSNLNSKARASAGTTKVTAIGSSVMDVISKSESSQNLVIAGKNIITDKTNVSMEHNSTANAEMDSVNVGLLLGVANLDISNDLISETHAAISGDYSANQTNIQMNTTRNSMLDLSNGSGGVINVATSSAHNKLNGTSTLTLDGINTDSDKTIQFVLNNKSLNTQDIKSHNGSGGFVNVGIDKSTSTFDTSTSVNINNSNINASGDIAFGAENTNTVKDSASIGSGGFVDIHKSSFDRDYKSGAYVTFDNSKISGENVTTTAKSTIVNAAGSSNRYKGTSVGAFVWNIIDVLNTINQTSKISLKNNSKIHAANKAEFDLRTDSQFGQKVATDTGGFSTKPKSTTRLNVFNNNELYIDSTSSIIGDNITKVCFDSSNNLFTGSTAEAIHAGFRDAEAYAYLYLVVNNTLNDNGGLVAGNLVDIDYMSNSNNQLTQDAKTKVTAIGFPATSDENGYIHKSVYNNMNVNSGGKIESGKNVDISFSAGKDKLSANVSWDNTTWVIIPFPPITFPVHSKDHKSLTTNNHNPSLKIDGSILAGSGNNKYMVINRDGTVNKEQTTGFFEKDYLLSDNTLTEEDGQLIKVKTLNTININIQNAVQNKTEKEAVVADYNEKISGLDEQKDLQQFVLDTYEDYLYNQGEGKNYTLKTEEEVQTIISNDIQNAYNQVFDSEQMTGIAAIITDYQSYVSKQQTDAAADLAHPELYQIQSLGEYIANKNYTYTHTEGETATQIAFTAEQKAQIAQINANAANKTIIHDFKDSENNVYFSFVTYDDKYIIATNPTSATVGSVTIYSCDEMKDVEKSISDIQSEIEQYNVLKADEQAAITALTGRIAALNNDKTATEAKSASDFINKDEDYSITFNDIKMDSAKINITGITNYSVSGNGNVEVASSGLRVDNYSSRSLIFNGIDMGENVQNSGLFINGKNHEIFANKPQAISGNSAYGYWYGSTPFENISTNGVHYISGTGSSVPAGITINNYFDLNHPFADSIGVINPNNLSNVVIIGNILNENYDLSILNENNSILLTGHLIKNKKMNLLTPNGSIIVFTGDFNLGDGSLLFAGDNAGVYSSNQNLNGKIKTGYKDRKIIITSDMLLDENLITDNSSGEKNMINLGGNTLSAYLNDTAEYGNIKAIYKDGQIYLYNIPENVSRGGYIFAPSINTNTMDLASDANVNILGNISYHKGYSNIEIINQTDKQLNIGNISNVDNEATVKEINNIVYDSAKIQTTENANATTTITSNGLISLNGEIKNSISKNYDAMQNQSGIYTMAAGGTLNVNANNGLNLNKLQKGDNVVDTISAGGDVNINVNNGTGNINGNIIDKGNINILNKDSADKLNINGQIKELDGNIVITNNSNAGADFKADSVVENVKGDTTITNNNGDLTIENGATIRNAESGNILAENKGGKFSISGLLKHFGHGNVIVKNSGDKAFEIATTGSISNIGGDISVENSGVAGIDIKGSINAEQKDITITNKNSDIRIGEYDSTNESGNDNYIATGAGNITINQTNGNILNNITDAGNLHRNYDLGNPNSAYKTLIKSGNDLIISVKDGDIGLTSHDNPGFSIDASTRDYTESINVNVCGNLIAKAINDTKDTKRLINIRAKESDLTIKDVTSDGNVILSSVDWKQTDTRPTPEDNSYFTGYSVLSSANADVPAVTGQNISIIASNNIGSDNKKLVYMQDTLSAPNSSVSVEAENDLNISAKANSDNETKLYQIISKHGTIDLDLESDGAIKEITSDKGLRITQKAQNLTIYDLGMPVSTEGASSAFNDILYAHDDLVYGKDSVSPEKSIIPNYIDIRVLDAINNPDRGDSYLKIYNAYVNGNHGKNAKYYPDGSRLADVTLMADNIYANSDKAPDSIVPTKANPSGYKQTNKSYSPVDFGSADTNTYPAKGINGFGDGEEISVDIIGVDRDLVNELVQNAQRNVYKMKTSNVNTSPKFKNYLDRMVFYDYDFNADNVVISVNDYAGTNRGVSIDTIYANNAYVNTHNTNLRVEDGNITNYAEFRNADKIAVVDNDYRRLLDFANIQLYTQKTGSFSLGLDGTINMTTTAPTVYNTPSMLVNGYHSAWSFVNREFKENKDLTEIKDIAAKLDKDNYNEPRISEIFDAAHDTGLKSDFEIYNISTTGVSVKNNGKLKRGKTTKITIKFDDVDVTVNAKVVNVEGNRAGLEFIDMPKDVANKILYRYMQRADAGRPNLTSSMQ